MSPLDDRITVTLHRLVHHIDGYADALLLDGFGLTYSQFHFLGALATMDTDEHPDLTEFAECLGVSKAAVSKRVPSFVSAGWITSSPDPRNARRLVLSLTPEGLDLVDRATLVLDAEFTSLFAGTDLDVAHLNGELRRALDILEAGTR